MISTYRLQLSAACTFADAVALVPYLASLGVGALYVSPLLVAQSGSEHGYDVADPTRVSEVLGGEAGRRELVAALRSHGMGLVVDIVPNHLGVADPLANPYWADVLRRGRASAYASWFDITSWPVRLPVLGASPAAVDELQVDGADGENSSLRYHEKAFPLAPGTGSGPARDVHAAQHYRLVPWNSDLSYRRFFAVSELAAVRVDHPDGLTAPTSYLQRLREHAPDTWLVVEKILEPGESLPRSWSVAGTTGYDALAEVDGVLVDPAGEAAFTALDSRLTGVRTSWPDLVHDCKLDVATGMLGPELRRLAALAPDVPDAGPALAEVLACFPVYRSYLPGGVAWLDDALASAAGRRPDLRGALDALSPRLHDPFDELAVRFQQTSGAVMAKGVEDTAYYRWTRFVALNEVGGDPGRFGLAPEEFHAALARRDEVAPWSMTTLSTHDTKRSADVRARLAVLAELPSRWAAAVEAFSRLAPVPDPALGHLVWQTVAGAWPLSRARLHAYLTKASREARTRTTWTEPDEEFERALHAVADACYDDPALRAAVEGLVAEVTPHGWSNSLSATLLQLAMPGLPDTYQGTELWDCSLVDPDNRRPVDFSARQELLARLDDGWLPPVDASGAAKLLVVSRALRARRDHPERFTGYTPLSACGSAAEHAVAFARRGVIAVATRLPVQLAARGGWGGATLPLPEGTWTDVLTGAPARPELADLLARYPVALLLED